MVLPFTILVALHQTHKFINIFLTWADVWGGPVDKLRNWVPGAV